jgi:hypothetical protein
MITRSVAPRVVAVLVGAKSLAWFASFDPTTEPILAIATLLLATLGLSVAIALWRRLGWSMPGYVVWAVSAWLRYVYRDMQVEPVAWKVAIGAAIVAAVLTVMGYFARATLVRR